MKQQNPFKNLKKPLLTGEDIFPFGKYQGEKLNRVAEEDPQYIIWASDEISQFKIDPQLVIACELDEAEEDEGYYNPFWD